VISLGITWWVDVKDIWRTCDCWGDRHRRFYDLKSIRTAKTFLIITNFNVIDFIILFWYYFSFFCQNCFKILINVFVCINKNDFMINLLWILKGLYIQLYSEMSLFSNQNFIHQISKECGVPPLDEEASAILQTFV